MKAALVTVSAVEYQRLLDSLSEISALRAELARLEEHLSREIAADRRRITKLEGKPEPRNRDRGEILAALILKNGGQITRKEARSLMRLSDQQFSQLLKASKDFITVTKSHRDKRIKILKLKR